MSLSILPPAWVSLKGNASFRRQTVSLGLLGGTVSGWRNWLSRWKESAPTCCCNPVCPGSAGNPVPICSNPWEPLQGRWAWPHSGCTHSFALPLKPARVARPALVLPLRLPKWTKFSFLSWPQEGVLPWQQPLSGEGCCDSTLELWCP